MVVLWALASGAFLFLAEDEGSSQGFPAFHNIAVKPSAPLTAGLTGGEFGGERVEAATVPGLRSNFSF
jgi:hypothetical protein